MKVDIREPLTDDELADLADDIQVLLLTVGEERLPVNMGRSIHELRERRSKDTTR